MGRHCEMHQRWHDRASASASTCAGVGVGATIHASPAPPPPSTPQLPMLDSFGNAHGVVRATPGGLTAVNHEAPPGCPISISVETLFHHVPEMVAVWFRPVCPVFHVDLGHVLNRVSVGRT